MLDGIDKNSLNNDDFTINESAANPLNQFDEIELVEQDELLNDDDIEIAIASELPVDSNLDPDSEGVDEVVNHSDAFDFICSECNMLKNVSNKSKKSTKTNLICIDCE